MWMEQMTKHVKRTDNRFVLFACAPLVFLVTTPHVPNTSTPMKEKGIAGWTRVFVRSAIFGCCCLPRNFRHITQFRIWDMIRRRYPSLQYYTFLLELSVSNRPWFFTFQWKWAKSNSVMWFILGILSGFTSRSDISCKSREVSNNKIKIKLCAFAGSRTSDPLLSSASLEPVDYPGS